MDLAPAAVRPQVLEAGLPKASGEATASAFAATGITGDRALAQRCQGTQR
ncbi:hypothetical protein FHY18_002938 [Xanthomonas arboricola]|nr:hypothetical protein [Xanthomonas sp. 3793]